MAVGQPSLLGPLLGSLANGGGNVDIVLDGLPEDLNVQLLSQLVTDFIVELLELLLLILGTHCGQQIEAHLLLGLLVQLHIIHGCVGLIDLSLEI